MRTNPQLFIRSLYRFGRRLLIYRLLGRLSYFILVSVALWLSVALADDLFYFSEVTRWGLLVINAGIIVYLAYLLLLKDVLAFVRFRHGADLSEMAWLVGRAYDVTSEDAVVNTYQLIARQAGSGSSSTLLEAAVENQLRRMQPFDFAARLRLADFMPAARTVILLVLAFIFLLAFYAGPIMHSTLRLLNPADEYLRVPPFSFSVEPGHARVIQNDPLNINVSYLGPALDAALLRISSPGQPENIRTLDMEVHDSLFRAEIKNVKGDLTYQVLGIPADRPDLQGKILSDVYRIKMVTLPEVRTLDVELVPPAYSGLPPQYLQRNIGDIIALKGTRINLSVNSSKNLQQLALKFDSGREIEGQFRQNSGQASFMVNHDDRYRIILQDTSGLSNRDPIHYRITTMADYAPFVDIAVPGDDVQAQLDGSMVVQVEAGDDFGLSAVSLRYRILRNGEDQDSVYKTIPLELTGSNSKKEILIYTWNFDRLPLTFENVIEYYAVALDNDRISGPKDGRTRLYQVQFPSLDELFADFEEQQDTRISEMEEQVREAEKLSESLEEITRELKRTEQLNWENRQQLQQTLEQQSEMIKKIEQIQEQLDQMVSQLDAQNLISEDVIQKYMQLQEMLREVASPELLKALKDLQAAMESPNSQQLQKALEQLRLHQEAFRENIERAMELLKQVQLEQKMDQLAQKARQLADQQQKITDLLKSDDAANEEARQLQEPQEQRADQLQQDIRDFLENPAMSDFPETGGELESADRQLQEESLQADLEQIMRELEAQNHPQAGRTAQRLNKSFRDIQQSVAAAQQKMIDHHKNEVLSKMTSATQKLLRLSHAQEGLQSELHGISTLSDRFADISVEQGRIAGNLQKVIADLIQLSRETFFMGPGINKSLGKARNNMQQSLDYLSERGKSAAERHQKEALAGLNESIGELRNAMSSLSQSGSGTGFEEFMEQMQQMAASQGQINAETMDLFNLQGNQGSLSLQQQMAMRRLAQQQQALQQAMQELGDQMGRRDDVLGRMGDIAGQMEEVVKDLLKENIDRRTIERQRQILSRMLDSQKSLAERELSQKRKAETAKDYRASDPGRLRAELDTDRKALMDALQRALQEGYGRDYQELIKAYFNKLLKQTDGE